MYKSDGRSVLKALVKGVIAHFLFAKDKGGTTRAWDVSDDVKHPLGCLDTASAYKSAKGLNRLGILFVVYQ